MTLTVQDLVTKFDDFADDAKVEIRRFTQDESSTVVHNVVGIRKGDNGNVILTTEFASIERDDHEESEDKELKILGYPSSKGFEDEESEDKDFEEE